MNALKNEVKLSYRISSLADYGRHCGQPAVIRKHIRCRAAAISSIPPLPLLPFIQHRFFYGEKCHIQAPFIGQQLCFYWPTKPCLANWPH